MSATPQKGFLRTRHWVAENIADAKAMREAELFITAVRPAGLRDALAADLRDCLTLARQHAGIPEPRPMSEEAAERLRKFREHPLYKA